MSFILGRKEDAGANRPLQFDQNEQFLIQLSNPNAFMEVAHLAVEEASERPSADALLRRVRHLGGLLIEPYEDLIDVSRFRLRNSCATPRSKVNDDITTKGAAIAIALIDENFSAYEVDELLVTSSKAETAEVVFGLDKQALYRSSGSFLNDCLMRYLHESEKKNPSTREPKQFIETGIKAIGLSDNQRISLITGFSLGISLLGAAHEGARNSRHTN